LETFGSLELENERNLLIKAANELRKILSAIILKVASK
jgi:hypothetical protein